ncbi:hypothetical protein ABHA59_08770 [Clostridium tertium]|uniref:hypothetical protein n=1 Tax=Clostridium tertium TaxID=1559 RepID=UPI00325AE36F
MRINEVIYFSPSTKMIDLDFNNKDMILKSFRERIDEFYFEPIKILNNSNKAFAAGTLIVSLIDIFANYSIGGKTGYRYRNWLKDNIDIEKNLQDDIYKYYRNGLIHEGFIKEGGEFSYEISESFVTVDLNSKTVMIINPKMMEEELKRYFEDYIAKLVTDRSLYEKFISTFKSQFQSEYALLRNETRGRG